MIEVRCSCGHRFGVDEDAAGLTADCPRCGEDVSISREGPVLLAQDPTPEPPENPLDGPESGRALTYSRGVPLDQYHDAITQPTAGFVRDVLGGFAVLFGGSNWGVPIIMAIADAALLVVVTLMAAFSRSPRFVVLVSTLGLLPAAWHCAIFFRACRAACAGDDQIRLVVIQEGVWEDLFTRISQLASAALV